MKSEIYDELGPIVQGNRLKRLYAHAFRGLTQREGMSSNELVVLLFLANNPKFNTAKDIVELRGLTKSHVCKSVEELSRRGMIQSLPDPHDRRRIQLFPTPEAQGDSEEGLAIQRSFFEALYEGVTAEENEALQRVFEKIWRNAQQMMRSTP